MYLYFELCKLVLKYSDTFYISNFYHQTHPLQYKGILRIASIIRKVWLLTSFFPLYSLA